MSEDSSRTLLAGPITVVLELDQLFFAFFSSLYKLASAPRFILLENGELVDNLVVI